MSEKKTFVVGSAGAEISADYSALKAQLSSIQGELKTVAATADNTAKRLEGMGGRGKKELSDTEKAVKGVTDKVRDLDAQVRQARLLGKPVDPQTIRSIAETRKQIDDMAKSIDRSKMSAQEFARSINQLDAAKAALGKKGTLGNLGQPSGVGAMMSKGATALGAAAVGGIVGIAATIGAEVTQQVGEAFVNATKTAIDFEKALDMVQVTAGASDAQMRGFRDELVELSKTRPVELLDMADGLNTIIGSGIDAANSMDVLRVAVDAAVGGNTSVAVSVDGITTAMNAWKDMNLSAKEASDQLFASVREGKGRFEEYASQLGVVAPIAASLNVPLSEVAASSAVLTLNGVKLGTAMSGLRQAMVNVLRPTNEFSEKFPELARNFDASRMQRDGFVKFLLDFQRESGGSREAAVALFSDIDGLNAVTGLLKDNGEQLTRVLREVESANGDTARAANTASGNLKSQYEIVKNQLSAAYMSLANLVFPSVAKGLEWLTGVFESETQKQIKALRKVGAEKPAEVLEKMERARKDKEEEVLAANNARRAAERVARSQLGVREQSAYAEGKGMIDPNEGNVRRHSQRILGDADYRKRREQLLMERLNSGKSTPAQAKRYADEITALRTINEEEKRRAEIIKQREEEANKAAGGGDGKGNGKGDGKPAGPPAPPAPSDPELKRSLDLVQQINSQYGKSFTLIDDLPTKARAAAKKVIAAEKELADFRLKAGKTPNAPDQQVIAALEKAKTEADQKLRSLTEKDFQTSEGAATGRGDARVAEARERLALMNEEYRVVQLVNDAYGTQYRTIDELPDRARALAKTVLDNAQAAKQLRDRLADAKMGYDAATQAQLASYDAAKKAAEGDLLRLQRTDLLTDSQRRGAEELAQMNEQRQLEADILQLLGIKTSSLDEVLRGQSQAYVELGRELAQVNKQYHEAVAALGMLGDAATEAERKQVAELDTRRKKIAGQMEKIAPFRKVADVLGLDAEQLELISPSALKAIREAVSEMDKLIRMRTQLNIMETSGAPGGEKRELQKRIREQEKTVKETWKGTAAEVANAGVDGELLVDVWGRLEGKAREAGIEAKRSAGFFSDLGGAADKMSKLANAVLQVGDALGGMDDATTQALGGIMDLGSGIARMASGDLLGGLAQTITGGIDSFRSLFGKTEADKEREREQRDATRDLIRALHDLNRTLLQNVAANQLRDDLAFIRGAAGGNIGLTRGSYRPLGIGRSRERIGEAGNAEDMRARYAELDQRYGTNLVQMFDDRMFAPLMDALNRLGVSVERQIEALGRFETSVDGITAKVDFSMDLDNISDTAVRFQMLAKAMLEAGQNAGDFQAALLEIASLDPNSGNFEMRRDAIIASVRGRLLEGGYDSGDFSPEQIRQFFSGFSDATANEGAKDQALRNVEGIGATQANRLIGYSAASAAYLRDIRALLGGRPYSNQQRTLVPNIDPMPLPVVDPRTGDIAPLPTVPQDPATAAANRLASALSGASAAGKGAGSLTVDVGGVALDLPGGIRDSRDLLAVLSDPSRQTELGRKIYELAAREVARRGGQGRPGDPVSLSVQTRSR